VGVSAVGVSAAGGGVCGMDLDAKPVVGVWDELGGELGAVLEGEHLFDLQPVHRHRVGGDREGLTGGGQGDLGETRRRHDRLVVHLVIGQPGDDLGAHLGLPDMAAPRRHFHVQAE
jgi:hypothetical protein